MIVFITTLPHPANIKNYSFIEKILTETLKSITNQTDKNFKIIITGYVKPELKNKDIEKYFEFIPVNITPFKLYDDQWERMEEFRIHKGLKLIIGINEAQKYNPDFIMTVDCDDYISSKIAAFVNTLDKTENGYYIDDGYILCNKTKQFWELNNFNNFCGTSLIMNNNLFKYPKYRELITIQIKPEKWIEIDTEKTDFLNKIKHDDTQEIILEKVNLNFIKYIIGSHKFAPKYFDLKPLPFPGAIWNWNTGENYIVNRVMKPKYKAVLKNPNDINLSEFSPDLPDFFKE
ncbi:MAG: hypothetical protein PHV06_06460 [bacterium]|nr:hypothetical protein [bacterium]